MATLTRTAVSSDSFSSGPYLAKIVSHLDPTYMGVLEVQLLHEVGNADSEDGQLHQVKYLSPFYGVTSVDFVSSGSNDYNNTQKSYGMWMIPPDVGTTVMVIFVEGDPKKGYWIGCVQDDKMNFMVPGYAATKYNVDGTADRVPVAEYNKILQDSVQDVTQYPKPTTPFEKVLNDQGLLKDDIRGITTSSARREVPSAVFGISTPGPVDKRDGATMGTVGKRSSKAGGVFVSRLGGSSFVMDDGDDKFLRKTAPSDGPPEYAAVEQGDLSGDATIPHNELIRLRTRTGHQILLHNSEDLIYIGNARGTTWIELSSDGKIDIFAEDSISVHTKQDLNFKADRDINLEAGRHFNVNVASEMCTRVGADQHLTVVGNQFITVAKTKDETVKQANKLTSLQTLDIKVTGALKTTAEGSYHLNTTGNNHFTASGTTHIKSGSDHIEEAAAAIHMNGKPATAADPADTAEPAKELVDHSLPDVGEPSILRRVPTREPWAHHENLDPAKFKPDITDRDSQGRFKSTSVTTTTDMEAPGTGWDKYSTVTDTFEKLGTPNEE